MARTDPKIQKWIRWLDILQAEIGSLVVAKHVFWSVQDMIKQNPKIQKHSEFYSYLGNTYIAYAIMGVRRQIKCDSQSVSLARLLKEIAEEPKQLSRKYYLGLYITTGHAHLADAHFDRFCDKPGDEFVSSGMVIQDLHQLKSDAELCEDLGDKRVAHYDRRAPKKLPKFKELDQVVEHLHKLWLKYRLVLLADSWTSLLPTFQYDWMEIFDHPWRLQNKETN